MILEIIIYDNVNNHNHSGKAKLSYYCEYNHISCVTYNIINILDVKYKGCAHCARNKFEIKLVISKPQQREGNHLKYLIIICGLIII